jgi:hypothetical protein
MRSRRYALARNRFAVHNNDGARTPPFNLYLAAIFGIQIVVQASSGFNIPAGWAQFKRSELAGAAHSFQQPRSNARPRAVFAVALFGAESETLWLPQLLFAVWRIISSSPITLWTSAFAPRARF